MEDTRNRAALHARRQRASRTAAPAQVSAETSPCVDCGTPWPASELLHAGHGLQCTSCADDGVEAARAHTVRQDRVLLAAALTCAALAVAVPLSGTPAASALTPTLSHLYAVAAGLAAGTILTLASAGTTVGVLSRMAAQRAHHRILTDDESSAPLSRWLLAALPAALLASGASIATLLWALSNVG